MKSALKYIGSLALGIAICIVVFSFLNADKPIKFVSMTEIFAENAEREQLEKKLEAFEAECNTKLKEMDDQIQQQRIDGADPAQIQYLRNELSHKRELLSEEYGEKKATYEAEVWGKINTKVEAYGKLKGYKFILGATGDGAIMYADDSEDITKEVIQYINKQ